MNTTRKLIHGGVALVFGASLLLAQQDPSGQRLPDYGTFANGRVQGNVVNFVPAWREHRPPPIPLVVAIDQNRDRIIDAAEMANASAALQQLDQNGDGVLSAEEFLPPRPPHHRGGLPNGEPPCPAHREQDQP